MEQIKSVMLENTTERRNKSPLQILYKIVQKIIGWQRTKLFIVQSCVFV